MSVHRGTLAGRIARWGKDATQSGSLFRFRNMVKGQPSCSPITSGPPVDRVVFVLGEIGTGFVSEAVMPHGGLFLVVVATWAGLRPLRTLLRLELTYEKNNHYSPLD